jgi:ribosomal protein L9
MEKHELDKLSDAFNVVSKFIKSNPQVIDGVSWASGDLRVDVNLDYYNNNKHMTAQEAKNKAQEYLNSDEYKAIVENDFQDVLKKIDKAASEGRSSVYGGGVRTKVIEKLESLGYTVDKGNIYWN